MFASFGWKRCGSGSGSGFMTNYFGSLGPNNYGSQIQTSVWICSSAFLYFTALEVFWYESSCASVWLIWYSNEKELPVLNIHIVLIFYCLERFYFAPYVIKAFKWCKRFFLWFMWKCISTLLVLEDKILITVSFFLRFFVQFIHFWFLLHCKFFTKLSWEMDCERLLHIPVLWISCVCSKQCCGSGSDPKGSKPFCRIWIWIP